MVPEPKWQTLAMERNVPGANISKLKEAGAIDLTLACMLSPLILCGKVVAIAKEIRVESVGPEHIVRSAKNMSNITWEDLLFITIFFVTAWWRLLLFWCRTFQLERSKPQQNDQWLQGGIFTRTHISVSWLCWDEKTCVYFFVYCWSFICFPWAKQKEAAIFCNSDSANSDIGHAEMMNVEKDRLARSATSTCLETAASVPDFMRTHVEEAEETWDCSIILVDPLLHRSVIFLLFWPFSISLSEK